ASTNPNWDLRFRTYNIPQNTSNLISLNQTTDGQASFNLQLVDSLFFKDGFVLGDQISGVDKGIRIHPNGNVGIGVIDPQARLDVNGEILMTHSTVDMGLITELENADPILNLAVNLFTPNVDANRIGGMFRIDSRVAVDDPLFQWINKPIGQTSATISNLLMTLDDGTGLSVNRTISAKERLFIGEGAQGLTLATDPANFRIHLDVAGQGHSSDAIVIGDLSNGVNEVIMLGNVGIGTYNTTNKLNVGTQGDGTKALANEWDTWSDKRLKRDFEELPDPLEMLQAINGYYYFWTEDKIDQTRQVGVIAQEIEAVLPEIVTNNSDGYKSVDYSKLVALLIEVNQAQEAKLTDQSEQLKQQQTEIDQLKAQVARIDQLEQLLTELQTEVQQPSPQE
ncbi:MAG: tail fiber domain-containing protein, partial [Bacteroidota bacterium]